MSYEALKMNLLERVRIVLVEPRVGGNIRERLRVR